MARIAMKCSCGWSFFVGETNPGWQAMCPNCGNAVPIPGRSPTAGGPRTPGQVAAQKLKEQKYTTLLIGIVGAIVLVGIILVVVLMSGGSAPETGTSEKAASKPGQPAPVTADPAVTDPTSQPAPEPSPTATTPPKPTPPPASTSTPPKPSSRPLDTEALRGELAVLIRETNMNAIVTEVSRLRGQAEPYETHFRKVATLASRCERIIAQLTEVGEKPVYEPRILPGDKILSLKGAAVAGVPPALGAAALEDWLRKYRPGITGDELLVQRGADRVPIYLFYPEDTPELIRLSRVPATFPASGAAIPLNPEPAAFPPELIQDLQTRMAALPPSYSGFVPAADRTRFERLAKATSGTPQELDFLKSRMRIEILEPLERDLSLIRSKPGELEPKLLSPTPTDRLHMKGGVKRDGTIEEETEEFVRLKQRFGTNTASVRLPKSDIERIERGVGPGPQFGKLRKEAEGDPTKLPALLDFCKRQNLKLEAEYAAWLILAHDPANEKARAETKTSKPTIRAGTPVENAAAPTLPPPLPAAANKAAKDRIEVVGREVAARYTTLSEVTSEVRKQTDGLRCSDAVTANVRYLPLLAHMPDPLAFKVADLSPEAGMETEKCWKGLSVQERMDFARYFGLWCAYARYSSGTK